MGCERKENYKNHNSSQGTCSRRMKCPFMLRFVSSNIVWNVIVRYGILNHELVKDLVIHDILGCLKPREI